MEHTLDELYPDRIQPWHVQEECSDSHCPTQDLTCEECEKRQAIYRCLNCSLTLCHKCTDALHIIPSMVDHTIRYLQEGDTGYVAVPRAVSIIQRALPTKESVLHLHTHCWGDTVTFRNPDIAPGLLFGTVVDGDQPRRGSNNVQYVRVLWIRGLLPLANNTYQAVLTLLHAWPVPVQEYVSMYHAFRAVVLSERIARKLWRREKYAGRLRKVQDLVRYPTDTLLSEMLTTIEDQIETVKDMHMTRDDFLAGVMRPPLRDEGDETELETDAPYPPRSRVQVLLLQSDQLTRPDIIRLKYIRDIIEHMIDLYVGFAWKAFHRNMLESRQQERQALEYSSAQIIQSWFKEQWRRQLQQRLALGRASGLDTMEVLRRATCRKDAVYKMHDIWQATLQRLKRRGIQKLKAVADALRVPIEKSAEPWHPALGVHLLKLPRAYAYMKSDGSLAVEDITKYKQFRQNHSGPTATSYWIVRGVLYGYSLSEISLERILLGRYPRGQAFPEKRDKRIAARSDSITCMLLDQISTFVSLLEDDECHTFEMSLDPEDRPKIKNQNEHFIFHTMIKQRHAKLAQELEHAVQAAEKYVVLATKSLEQLKARRDTEEFVLDLAVKKKALSENNYQQALANSRQLRPLQFEQFSTRHNQVPSEVHLRAFLEKLEARLRAGENLYIFCADGRGRTGLIGALLLGRLYGLSPNQALERQQRCHDCQRIVANLPSTRLLSSPEAQTHINMVHKMLATTDTIYSSVITAGDDYRVVRAQRRGLGVQTYAETNGFMVESFPSPEAIVFERRADFQAHRIAKREVRAMHIRWRRRLQAMETIAMTSADIESSYIPPPSPRHMEVDVEFSQDDIQVHALLDDMLEWLAKDMIGDTTHLDAQENLEENI